MMMGILDHATLSIEEKAERNQPLPEQLNIVEIVDLWFKSKRDREIYYGALFKAFDDDNGLLRGKKLFNNPYTEDGDYWVVVGGHEAYWNIEITRDDFLDWLKIKGEPLPKDCLLANWWKGLELKTEAEAVGDAGIGNHAGTEPKPLNQNSNNSDFSGLLNNPSKKDDWFLVIDDMTRGFHAKFGKIPNETQAWGALWKNPPEGYEITTGKDRGDDCLIMPGITNLSKRAFNERWKKYTAPIQDKAF